MPITTLAPRPAHLDDELVVPALFDDTRVKLDELTGAVPTWRMDEEPIYLEVVRDLGVPGTLTGPAPGDVVVGEVLPPTEAMDLGHLFDDAPVDDGVVVPLPPTEPIDVVPTPTKALALPVTGKGGRTRRAPRPKTARRAA